MAQSQWLLGIDLGASALKCVKLELDGKITIFRQQLATSYPYLGWAEQNPMDWLYGVNNLLGQMDCLKSPPLAIAISGGAHIPVLLGSKLQPLRAAILWSDQRSKKEVDLLRSEYKQYIHQHCFNTPSATWTLPMLMWLRDNEPKIIAQTKMVLFAKDYLRYALTGEIATDPSDAVGSMLAEQPNVCWNEVLCKLAGISVAQLPPIRSSTDVIGTTSAMQTLRIAAGIPVICGSIDTSAELLTAGALEAGSSVLKLATAGVYSWVCTDAQCLAPVSCYPHVYRKRNYFATGTNSCMSSLQWFSNTFVGNYNLGKLDELVSAASDSCPLFHPYLIGERAPLWNANLRAAISGLSIEHGLSEIALAVYRGICYSLRHLIEQSKVTPATLRLIGGGTNSPVLLAILASTLNQPLVVKRPSDASIGAAILAGVGIEIFDNWQQAIDLITSNHILIEPDREKVTMYNNDYQKYLAMIESLEG